jgi:DNA-binding NarL/FixJ family response regulator
MESKIKLMLVDDHNIFREGLRVVLTQNSKYEIVGEAENGRHFLEKLETTQPDVVLMDISMPEMDGIEATQKAREIYNNLNVIALTSFGDEIYYYKMIEAGVKGFVIKKSSSHELENAITAIMNGDNYFSQELLKNIIITLGDRKKAESNKGLVHFTRRELEILKYVCNGYSNQEISNLLNLSLRTVETHKSNILGKTGTKNTVNLIMYAMKNKLFEEMK